MKKNNKDLKKFIRTAILESLNNVMLSEDKKDGPAKPTSGLKKVESGTTHTDTKKEVKPKASKITPDAPEKSTLSNAEPTEVDNEVKVMKDKEEPKSDGHTYKCDDCYGAKLEVKGPSYADINSLYLMGQIKKSLEGKGPKVVSVKIEMGFPEKNKVEESKQIQDLRKAVRKIVLEYISKNKKKRS